MDPLSIAASVAGLVSLTLDVSRTVGSYYKAAKDASKSIQEIQQELLLMHSILMQLGDLLQSQQMKSNSFARSSVLATAVTSCTQSIEAIYSALRRPKQDGLSRVKEALKWPFGEKEIQKRLETLRRYTSMFQFSLTVEGCKLLSRTSEDVADSLVMQLETSQKVFELTKDIRTMAESAKEASRVSSQTAEILQVINNVHGTASVIHDLSEDVRAISIMSQDAKNQQILDWLSPTRYSSKHNDIRVRRLPGTGQWLLDCKTFQAWLEHANPVLWCTGAPGVGKSVLTSLVIDHILSKVLLRNEALAYFYFDYREQDIQSPASFLASLLHQLAVQKADFPRPLFEFHEHFKQDKAQSSMTDLLTVFQEVCVSFDKIYIVIDALDECNSKGYRKQVLTILEGLDLGTIRLFVTSRPHSHDIKQHFTSTQRIQIEASEADLKSYCYRMMNDNDNTREIVDDDLEKEVADTIAGNAQGMFLLPVLQIQAILEAMTKSEIRKTLRKLSASLGQAFEDTISRIGNDTPNRQHVALRSLMWVSRARRPLRIDELRHALATEIGDNRFDKDNLLQARFIVDCCSGLIVIDDESLTVRLVHYTLQDYLQSRRQHQVSEDETQITAVCLTYLCFDEMDISNFVDYAAPHWGHHARNASINEISDLALVFLRNLPLVARAGKYRRHSSLGRQDFLQCHSNLTGLHVVAHFGLAELANLLLNGGLPVDSRDGRKNTALHEAACNGQEEVANVLLERGGKVDLMNADFNTPLYLAVSNGHEQLALQLLKHGASPNRHCLDDWTALHKATDEGQIAIVKLLLDHGASIHDESARGLIALHRAAGRGYLDVVKHLLEQGSPVDALTQDGWTPLHGASSSGKHEAVKLLLENGASINLQSDDGRTPLHRACRGGQFMTVWTLLAQGADHMIRDSGSYISLHQAAKGGHERIGRKLLEQDLSTKSAQLSAVHDNGRTPREEASYSGHWRMAALLRDEEIGSHGPSWSRSDLEVAVEENDLSRVVEIATLGVNVNEPNSEGLTPLHQALLMGRENIAEALIKNDASLDAKTPNGWFPLHCAAQNGDLGPVKLCLEYGAEVAARTPDGQNALHKVCRSGNVTTTKLLLEKGADIKARDDFGWQPIHTAAAAGFRGIVELLLESGADVWARDKEGGSVHACAAREGHHALVEYLRMEKP